MTDILFLSLPKLNNDGPILSLAQLTACAKQAGFSAAFLDFNAWLYNETKDTELSYIWNTQDFTLITNETISAIEQEYNEYFSKFYETKIKKFEPKIIGLTAFSHWTFPSIRIVSAFIKRVDPNIKILLGGPGITVNAKKLNLVDDFITGDADLSLVEYLKGNKDYPGINNYDYNNNYDRNSLPLPDYSDIDFSLYKNPVLYISGSRGCVRKCAFCNVPVLWDKFMWKSGETIADQMIELSEKYGIKRLRFTDSLINGNQKEFEKMLDVLSEYNKFTKQKISFNGQFIFRESRFIKDELFDKMVEAGYRYISVGIESGSEKIRREIGKPFSNEAIEYHLKQMRRTGMKMTALMFVGFPTETDEDFQETIKILDLFVKYNDVVMEISSDHPMILIPDTPAFLNKEKFGILDSHSQDMFEWKSKYNDYKTRIERHIIFLDEATKRNLFKSPKVSGKLFKFSEDYLNHYTEHDQKVLKIIERFREDVK